ncbi:MAG: outer membrane protein transport protein [Holophagales bacterium]|nr:outer membrane protein transport protein [Holophagales bacterium]
MLRGCSRFGLGGLSLLLAAALFVAGPAAAAGFSIFEAGSRSTAMGGAFVAQADDLSAMFYNPAGLAEFTEKGKLKTMAGVTLIIPTSKMEEGYNPYPGQGYQAEMTDQFFFPPNLYASYGLSECVSLSFGTWFPFGLATRWDNPDEFRGRFLSQYADLKQYAAGLQIAWKINDVISIGVGPEARFSTVKLQGKVPLFDPFTNRIVDAAHADIRGDLEVDLTFGAGIKLNPTPNLSIGASYHGAVDADFGGTAMFYSLDTGNAQLNAAFASKIPVNKDVPVKTTIQFPAQTQIGIGYDFGKLTLQAAGTFTEWSAFDTTVLEFESVDGKQVPTSVLPHDWEDAWALRFGAKYAMSDTFDLMGGFVYDQTPEPDGDVGPLLPDANRRGYSVGFSWKITKRTWLDFSNLYLTFSERSVTTNDDNFNGRYKNTANLTVLNLRTNF